MTLEDPEQPSEEEFEAARVEPPRGILYERPSRKHLFTPIAFALLCVIASLFFWFSDRAHDALWVSRSSVFDDHEYWRLATAVLTHADVGHILSNLPLLIIFGWFLRFYFGFVAFPLVSTLIGILTNVATLYFYPDNLRLIGASGMLFGVVALWTMFYLRYEIRYSLGRKILRALGFLLVLLFPATYNPTTSYLSHIFGFIFGVLFAVVLMATRIYDRRQKTFE